MKLSPSSLGAAFGIGLAWITTASAQTPPPAVNLDNELKQVALDYTGRIETATNELNAARVRIATEKVPVLNQMRSIEDRILRLQSEVAALRIENGQLDDERARREQEATAQRANISYVSGLAADGIGTLNNVLSPAEINEWKGRLEGLRQRLDPTNGQPDLSAAVETSELLLGRIESLIGGYTAAGVAVDAETSELVEGTYAFFGPETFFVANAAGGAAGTVRSREEGAAPIVHATGWDHDEAAAFVAGRESNILVDISGGKALQLRTSQGNWIDHINKGGIVGYVIIGLGLFALLTAVLKLVDLRKLSVDHPANIRQVLQTVATDGRAAAEKLLGGMLATSRELYTVGLRHMDKPKEVVEEYLHAFILRERLHHERWLPMLAVIAAASPLLGLLGTVVGMVKTFTLITVFGTGNAGKLSSGISEALVTTELGLIVAIPTLVIHGFLSHRTQKNLSLLERYAVELVTATDEHKVARGS